MELAHAAICVSDLDRAMEFYAALGFEETHRFTLNGVENVYIGASEDDGEITTESSDSASGDEGAASSDPDGALQLRHDPDRTTPIAPSRADVDHLAFTVEDVEATFEAAIEAGGAAVLEPTEIEPADAYAAFVEDPEGYTVEFYRGL